MGLLVFIVYTVAIVIVYARRGALAGCFSIPLALIAGVWTGINVSMNVGAPQYIMPLLLTVALALMVFLPSKPNLADENVRPAQVTGDGSSWQNKPISPVLNNADGRVWSPSFGADAADWIGGVPSTATEIVEVDRSEYLPDTTDAGDLAARKLDEDFENGVIDRATYVAGRKKLAQ